MKKSLKNKLPEPEKSNVENILNHQNAWRRRKSSRPKEIINAAKKIPLIKTANTLKPITTNIKIKA